MQLATFEQRAIGRDNNLNLLRMIAASAVLVSHAYPLTIGKDALEPLLASTGYKLGTTAVTIFFAVSGFLITKSFDRRNSTPDFLLARVARIYPALVVVLALSAFALGPVFTKLSLGAYFSDRHTWTYVPRDLMLRNQQWTLPGLFLDAPGGPAVNGSLWTLFSEVSCYGLVMVCGYAGLLRPKLFPAVMAIAIGLCIFVPQGEGGGLARAAAILTLPFAIGGAVYVYRSLVPVSGLLALGLIIFAVIFRPTPAYPIIHAAAVSYGALWFGFANLPRLRRYNLVGDFSYGMYIYAFPVQQVVAVTVRPHTPLLMIALSFPVTLSFAAASWFLVENKALAHRHIIAARVRQSRRGAARGNTHRSD